MKLIAFDFDDTLFLTPDPKMGSLQFKKKTGTDWPHRGWWGRAESLDLNIFDIPLNPGVYRQYLHYKSDPNNYIILATGRLTKLENEVVEILSKNNLEFDEIFLNPGMDTLRFKINLFEDLIGKKKPDEFILFDDREPHLEKFRIWADSQKCRVTVVDAKKL